jgi:hypothetical protein
VGFHTSNQLVFGLVATWATWNPAVECPVSSATNAPDSAPLENPNVNPNKVAETATPPDPTVDNPSSAAWIVDADDRNVIGAVVCPPTSSV